MTDYPESIRIKMLQDAGCSAALADKYVKLVDFVKQTSIDIVHSEFMADKVRERALKLLKEIGEIE